MEGGKESDLEDEYWTRAVEYRTNLEHSESEVMRRSLTTTIAISRLITGNLDEYGGRVGGTA